MRTLYSIVRTMGAALTLADAGEMLGEVDSCLRLRRDTLVMLIHVGEDLRRRAECYRQRLRWRSSGRKPAVSLYEEVPAT